MPDVHTEVLSRQAHAILRLVDLLHLWIAVNQSRSLEGLNWELKLYITYEIAKHAHNTCIRS